MSSVNYPYKTGCKLQAASYKSVSAAQWLEACGPYGAPDSEHAQQNSSYTIIKTKLYAL